MTIKLICRKHKVEIVSGLKCPKDPRCAEFSEEDITFPEAPLVETEPIPEGEHSPPPIPESVLLSTHPVSDQPVEGPEVDDTQLAEMTQTKTVSATRIQTKKKQ